MTRDKEIRLFVAFVYTIAIIFASSYFLLSGQPEEFKLQDNELYAIRLKGISKHEDKTNAEESKRKYFEVLNALNNADKLTLFSLEPKSNSFTESPLLEEIKDKNFKNLPYTPPPQYLYGTLILGQTELKGKDIKIATQAFREAVGGGITFCVDCYQPRHALRARYKEHTYDFTICYTCLEVRIKKDGKYFAGYRGNTGEKQDILTDLLRKHNVPLPYIFTEQAKQDIADEYP